MRGNFDSSFANCCRRYGRGYYTDGAQSNALSDFDPTSIRSLLYSAFAVADFATSDDLLARLRGVFYDKNSGAMVSVTFDFVS
jgi:hypothetical protein